MDSGARHQPHRYRDFISDIAGRDIRSHGSEAENAIREVRDWLLATSRGTGLIGGGEIIEHFRRFRTICRRFVKKRVWSRTV